MPGRRSARAFRAPRSASSQGDVVVDGRQYWRGLGVRVRRRLLLRQLRGDTAVDHFQRPLRLGGSTGALLRGHMQLHGDFGVSGAAFVLALSEVGVVLLSLSIVVCAGAFLVSE